MESKSLSKAILETTENFRETVLNDFDRCSDQQILLYGDVQSGKTSHMLGLVTDCLDQNFKTVIILTSPNIRLVNQTFDRVFDTVADALILESDDTDKFEKNENRTRINPQKTVIVIGKISKTLKRWVDVFRRTNALRGHPILIIDDEADATSLNTKINKDEVSTINAHLNEIRDMSTGCLYVQVTGTPQAVVLQSESDGWAPATSLYFEPGEGYIGGNLFFDEIQGNAYTRSFPPTEASEPLYFRSAVLTHMVTCTFFYINGWPTCNMMVHPSHLTPVHSDYLAEIKNIVTDVYSEFSSSDMVRDLKKVYDQLTETYSEAPAFEEVLDVLPQLKSQFKYLLVNGENDTREEDWSMGYNFIVGGNSLGRGLTFDYLQTVFYVRVAKRPQADTVWQHARMFGYKRHKETLRWFLPSTLAKMFNEVHQGNEILKQQLRSGTPVDQLRVVLDRSISPTRPSVLSKKKVNSIIGGVNYFAEDPINIDFERLDTRLKDIQQRNGGNDFLLTPTAVNSVLDEFQADPDDLDLETFKVALKRYEETDPDKLVRVVLRTGRKVSHGTGTLLSPDDRDLADNETASPIVILYRIEGVNASAVANGRSVWSSDPIWVPNIKLPELRQYWRVEA